MTDEIFNLMRFFPESRITPYQEVILDRKAALSFCLKGVDSERDIQCKLLEWCSRPIAKGLIYADPKKNRDYRRSLLLGYNNYLGTHFDEADIYLIYDRLGNAINHQKTIGFIDNCFNLALLKEAEE